MSTAFYAMSSDVYFLGAVAMINSLRLQGHDEPIYLLDCGLTARQRELIAPQATLVAAPLDAAPQPHLMKTIAPLAHPAEVMVLIDVDMIVTRPLGELIERAGEGRVVAFENYFDRFLPEWGELLDLGPLERRPYLCSGFVAMGADPGDEVLRLVEDRQRRAEFERGFVAANEPDYPLLYLDQDVLNAVLAARVAGDRVDSLASTLAPVPPYAGLEVLDERTLRCGYADGEQPWLVHQYLSPKPWEGPTYDGVYSRLLRRLLGAGDLAIRVPTAMVPRRLRSGSLGSIERRRVNLREQLRWRLGGFWHEHRPSGSGGGG